MISAFIQKRKRGRDSVHGVEIVSQGLEIVSQGLELVTQSLELVSQGLELGKNITMSFPSHRNCQY
jgi:hypothetical protein